MTYEEIKAELSQMAKALTAKAVEGASAELHVNSDMGDVLWLRGVGNQFEGFGFRTFRGNTNREIFDDAHAFIAGLPEESEVTTREYLTRVASAVDYATEHSLPDEYVTPLREVTCAMTENLLTDKREATQ